VAQKASKGVIYMKKSVRKLDLNKLIKNNPNVNPEEFSRAIQILGELQKQGINVSGPNYNLDSPFSRPESHGEKSHPAGSVLRPK
jgi:shikimate 5-dehydrogenase